MRIAFFQVTHSVCDGKNKFIYIASSLQHTQTPTRWLYAIDIEVKSNDSTKRTARIMDVFPIATARIWNKSIGTPTGGRQTDWRTCYKWLSIYRLRWVCVRSPRTETFMFVCVYVYFGAKILKSSLRRNDVDDDSKCRKSRWNGMKIHTRNGRRFRGLVTSFLSSSSSSQSLCVYIFDFIYISCLRESRLLMRCFFPTRCRGAQIEMSVADLRRLNGQNKYPRKTFAGNGYK